MLDEAQQLFFISVIAILVFLTLLWSFCVKHYYQYIKTNCPDLSETLGQPRAYLFQSPKKEVGFLLHILFYKNLDAKYFSDPVLMKHLRLLRFIFILYSLVFLAVLFYVARLFIFF